MDHCAGSCAAVHRLYRPSSHPSAVPSAAHSVSPSSTPTNPFLLTQQSNILSYCRTITVECSSICPTIDMFEHCTCDETHTDLVELAHRSGTAIHRIYTALHHRSRVRFCFSVAFCSFCPTGQAIHHQFRRPAYHRSPVAYRLPRLRLFRARVLA